MKLDKMLIIFLKNILVSSDQPLVEKKKPSSKVPKILLALTVLYFFHIGDPFPFIPGELSFLSKNSCLSLPF